jgi:chromosome segregation ATPase
MSEDTTQRLPNSSSFEERVLSELAAIRGDIAVLDKHLTSVDNRLATVENRLSIVENRLTTLEDKVDARLRETRPIWENVQVKLTAIETTLEDIQSQLREVVRDLFSMRGRINRLEERDRTPA